MSVEELDVNIDYEKLMHDYERLDIDNILKGSYSDHAHYNQIAVQCRPECPVEEQLYQGTGSLVYDWSKLDEDGNPTMLPKRFKQYEFTEIAEYFKGSYFEEAINIVNEKFTIHRTRIMMSKPKSCLSTHTDATRRIHIPLVTNEDCYMVFTDKVYRMPFGKTYIADTTETHTAVNASTQRRTHIVMCIHEPPKYR